jgi:hypothetical protein
VKKKNHKIHGSIENIKIDLKKKTEILPKKKNIQSKKLLIFGNKINTNFQMRLITNFNDFYKFNDNKANFYSIY